LPEREAVGGAPEIERATTSQIMYIYIYIYADIRICIGLATSQSMYNVSIVGLLCAHARTAG